MPLKLDIKRHLTARSDRVKCLDLHSNESWLLCALYSGDVIIWNHETQAQIKKFEVCNVPVRAAKFVARKNWMVSGSDDLYIRVYNYNTLELINSFEAHSDYIRCIIVHSSQPYLLTSSDDLLIKLWNWEKGWTCQQSFQSHTHYVMQIALNPKDNNMFASASLDATIKVWQLDSSLPNFTLMGHERGVNCVDYYHGSEKPYIISGSDDNTIKVWDFHNKTCIHTLNGHNQNVTCVKFHPELPVLISGSEDGCIKLWHTGVFRLETSLNYGFERIWSISVLKGSNSIAFGCDEGTVMVKVGRDEPAISMDYTGTKIIWAKNFEIQQSNLKLISEEVETRDGEQLPLLAKDLGACEIYPQKITHSPNGRFVAVCGDGEYIIYTSMALRNKAYGNAQEFVWASDGTEYAILENSSTIKVFQNFKQRKSFKPEYGADKIFGGHMLGVKSINGTAFFFYDWEQLELIRHIEIQPKNVYWSLNGNLVCLASDNSYYVLKYNATAVLQAKEAKTNITQDGIEDAFEVLKEINEVVKSGLWISDCFVYISSDRKLNYFVGVEVVNISHLEKELFILGYDAKENKLYLNDKELNVYSYTLTLSVLQYQTAIIQGDFETADKILLNVPKEHFNRIAVFLEKQGYHEKALEVTLDFEHMFELALSIGNLDKAKELLLKQLSISDETTTHSSKWARLGSAALSVLDIELAKLSFNNAYDYSATLLLAVSFNDVTLLEEVARNSLKNGFLNIAFSAYFMLQNLDECLSILINTNRLPEAAFFARSYLPSKVSYIVELWKKQIALSNLKLSQSIADPDHYENLFPELSKMIQA